MKNRIYLKDLDDTGIRGLLEVYDKTSNLKFGTDSTILNAWLDKNSPITLELKDDGLYVGAELTGPRVTPSMARYHRLENPLRKLNPRTTYFEFVAVEYAATE